MRAMILGLCAVVSASPALADPQTGLFEWQVSADGGATWSSSVTLNPGDAYQIRGRASWSGGDIPSPAFGIANFEQIDLIGADGTDIFGGASGPGSTPTYLTRLQGTPVTWTLQAGSGASASGLKIDSMASPPFDGAALAQLPYALPGGGLNPTYTRDNPAVALLLTAVAGSPKTLTISSPWKRAGSPASPEFYIYTSDSGAPKKPAQDAWLVEATVTIIPAPATLVAFVTLPFLRCRRHRG